MNLPRVRVVVQARMRSFRLPGKVLADLAGRPMLAYTVGRLAAAPGDRRQIVVATSTAAADDELVDACRAEGVEFMRGSESDVLARFVTATDDLSAGDIVVRATADNPLYCPRRTGAIIDDHLRRGGDYTCIERLSYVVPEVMRVGALRAMAELARDACCREHVTPYFREAEHGFRVRQLPQDWLGLRPDIRLTVDTPEELHRMRSICLAFAAEGLLFSIDKVYEHLRVPMSAAG